MRSLRQSSMLIAGIALALPAAALERSDVVRRELSFAPGGERLVVIDNVMGGVEVRAGQADRVTVEIRRTVTARREGELTRGFDEVVLAVEGWSGGVALYQDGPFRCRERRSSREARDDGEAHDDGGSVRDAGRSIGRSVGRAIGRSWGEPRRDWSGDCRWDPDYELDWQWLVTVPADVDLEVTTVNEGTVEVSGVRGRVRAGNVNGPLRLAGLAGEVRAATVNGGIVVEYAVAPAADASFESVNGSIEIAFPIGTSADVEMETMNGELWSDFEVTAAPRRPEPTATRRGGNRFRLEHDTVVRLGAGGPRFECTTLNGDIVLRER